MAKTHITRTKRGTENERWQTPPAVFRALDAEFGPFDVDLCADADNRLCDRWVGPGSTSWEDALEGFNWRMLGRRAFCNPPYDTRFMYRLFARASQQAHARNPRETVTTVFLVPFRASVIRSAVLQHGATPYLCDKRITFFENGAPRFDERGRPSSATFDSCVLVFSHGINRELRTFEVPRHVDVD